MSHPHLQSSPIYLNLRDLPPEGRTLTFSHVSGELTKSLEDLLGNNAYSIEVTVRPLGNIFEAQGAIQAQMDQTCSLCADDYKKDLKLPFRELLVIQEAPSRGGHTARVNHVSELDLDAPEVTELRSETFALGEFFHELIAISIPIRTTRWPNCEQTCERYLELVRSGRLLGQQDQQFNRASPFSVLQDVKLNR